MKMRGCLITLLVVALVIGTVIFLLSDFELVKSQNRIGVVEIKGTITSSQETLKQLKEFRKDDSIKALLVRIDSPGGAVGPSQEIYREIRRTIDKKPVVASLGGVAASGGYYIAAASSHIVSNPGTITGSIGVIIHFPYLRELFDKIGYNMVTIKSGEYKDIGNPGREMTPEERQLIQGSIDDAHAQFVQDVAQGRRLPAEEVKRIADGRIIMGSRALELKLIDELGNFEDAVSKAASLGKIPGEPDLVYGKKKRLSLLDWVIGGDASEKLNDFVFDSFSFLRYQLPSAR